MVLWLPSTWFEDLGEAERVTPYRIVKSKKVPTDWGHHIYFVFADIMINGKRVRERTFGTSLPAESAPLLFPQYGPLARASLIDKFRKEMREKYCK